MTVSNHDRLARLLIDAGSFAASGGDEQGRQLIHEHWPHVPPIRQKRTATLAQRLKVFRADGYRCRYTGDLLLLPAYMIALSALWPETFPAHPNGKAEEAHEAYWTHFPSVEHVKPIAEGGPDSEENWITTSMARNQVRSRYPLDALGWSVRPREVCADWDGGVLGFLDLVDRRHELLQDPRWGDYLRKWHRGVKSENANS